MFCPMTLGLSVPKFIYEVLTPLKENLMKQVSMIVAVFLVTAVTVPTFAGDVTYRKDIRPLFQKQCASCHGANAPYLGEYKENKTQFLAKDLGPRMDTYADLIFFIGWPDTGRHHASPG